MGEREKLLLGRTGSPDADGDSDLSEKKDLAGLGITIEIADLERDSQAVAEIYSQDSITSHLAGVAPGMLNEERYQELRETYGPLIAATSEGVKGYYTKHTDETLYVAKTKGGKVVGVVTSQPEGVGVTIVNVGRLAVHENYIKRGIATKLVEKVRDEASKITSPRTTQIGAAILREVDNSDVTFLFFSSLGFKLTGQVDKTCISWDPAAKDFLNRGSWRMALHLP